MGSSVSLWPRDAAMEWYLRWREIHVSLGVSVTSTRRSPFFHSFFFVLSVSLFVCLHLSHLTSLSLSLPLLAASCKRAFETFRNEQRKVNSTRSHRVHFFFICWMKWHIVGAHEVRCSTKHRAPPFIHVQCRIHRPSEHNDEHPSLTSFGARLRESTKINVIFYFDCISHFISFYISFRLFFLYYFYFFVFFAHTVLLIRRHHHRHPHSSV